MQFVEKDRQLHLVTAAELLQQITHKLSVHISADTSPMLPITDTGSVQFVNYKQKSQYILTCFNFKY